MIDAFDIIAFVVFAVLLAAAVIIVVVLGSLPGRIARSRGHPQAAAINVCSWLGLATLGLLWPIAFIWAFSKPLFAQSVSPRAEPDKPPDQNGDRLAQMQSRVDKLEAALRKLRDEKEVSP